VSPTHKRLILLLIEDRIGAERALGFASAIANAAALEEVLASFLRDQKELEDLRSWHADATAEGC
jgi:hypothetical protein